MTTSPNDGERRPADSDPVGDPVGRGQPVPADDEIEERWAERDRELDRRSRPSSDERDEARRSKLRTEGERPDGDIIASDVEDR